MHSWARCSTRARPDARAGGQTSVTRCPIPRLRNESDEVLVKASVISELQRWVLKSKVALREKEEENDILRQRLQQYDNRCEVGQQN
uniref:Uncharacterized protein n=1 Tax=Brassica oleracea var. oleracea TaxID=109376 RepID=A0A0D3CPQ8_BRAOL